jgi:hypothetical protein
MGLLSSIGKGLKDIAKAAFDPKTIGASLGGAPGAIGGAFLDSAMKKRDLKNQYQVGMQYGLTPTELAGSVSGGSGYGLSQTLGNNYKDLAMQAKQQAYDMSERAKDRQTNLAQSAIAAEASIQSSNISAGASRYSADIQKAIADGKLDLDTKSYNNILLPRAASELDLNQAELDKRINEIATSAPEFLRAMKLLSMGPENTMQQLILNNSGVDVTDPKSVQNASVAQRKAILGSLLAISSGTTSTFSGVREILGSMIGLETPGSEALQ